MKKFIIAFIFLFILFGFWAQSATAQEDLPAQSGSFTYERAYNDYIYNLDQYQRVHGEYEIAKNGYLKNPTLAAQAEAIQKTKSMLTVRDEVLKTYLVSLKLKILETTG